MEQIRLDIIPKGLMPVCHSSQYDKGRVIRLNLVDGLQGYTLTDETVTLNVRKPDNNIVTAGVNVISGASYVDIVTTEQMTACEGENLCEIVITKGDVKIASLNFKMKVEADPLKDGIESETVIHDLKTTISDMVKEEIEAISPEEELSGAMASFETHEIAPLVDCKVKIEAIQSGSGTPSPDNVRPITGFTGANIKVAGNLLNDNRYQFSNNTVMLGESAGNTYSTHLKATTYTISFKRPTSVPFKVYYNKLGGSAIDIMTYGQTTSASFTVAEEGDYRLVAYYNSGAVAPTDITEIILTGGSEVKPYTPYTTPTTTPITWQTEAGTVYGGLLDVTTGVLTVTHKGLSINSSSNFVSFSVGTANANATFNLTDATIETSGGGSKKGAISSTGQENPLYWSADRKNETPDNGNMSFAINGNGTTVRFYITENFENIHTIDDFKNAFTATTLVYPLATPQTYQLTPTQIKTILGVNNIWADTGDIDVVYHHELTARYVYFDNTGTDLTATNVEAAIKELWSRLQ